LCSQWPGPTRGRGRPSRKASPTAGRRVGRLRGPTIRRCAARPTCQLALLAARSCDAELLIPPGIGGGGCQGAGELACGFTVGFSSPQCGACGAAIGLHWRRIVIWGGIKLSGPNQPRPALITQVNLLFCSRLGSTQHHSMLGDFVLQQFRFPDAGRASQILEKNSCLAEPRRPRAPAGHPPSVVILAHAASSRINMLRDLMYCL